MKKYFKYFLTINILLLAFLVLPNSTYAGTINLTNRYAWSENAGWIDFGCDNCNVQITDTGLTGYAYGENIGWISLNCLNDNSCSTVDYGVVNDGQGKLSGYAWSENAGWINFNPSAQYRVSVDHLGYFNGYAFGENIGWVVFNCSTTNSCNTVDYKISTSGYNAPYSVGTIVVNTQENIPVEPEITQPQTQIQDNQTQVQLQDSQTQDARIPLMEKIIEILKQIIDTIIKQKKLI